MPRKIATVDCETDPFRKGRVQIAPFLWGLYDGEFYHEFEDILDLVAYLEDKPLIVYAHNGGKFDWHFIISLIEPFTELMIINGRLSKFRIGKCEFRDSFNILPVALSAYQKTEINYDIMEKEERHKPENWQVIRDYLRDDCVFLYDLVSQFIDQYGINLTLAGSAMKQWEKISGLKPPKDEDGQLYEKFKPFYHGGRCQAFSYGVIESDFSMVDINSAYPFAMLHNHPYGIGYIELNHGDWLALDQPEQGTCLLSVVAESGGGLPYKGSDGSLYFPDDYKSRTYCCSGWELIAAIDTGTIRNWHIEEAFYFPDQVDFRDYINEFYSKRQEIKEKGKDIDKEDKANSIFYKLLMNSLYGKFGSNPHNYANYQNAPPEFINDNGEIIIENDDGLEQAWSFNGDFGNYALITKDLEEDEQRFYNIATAASITGYVRAYMWRALCQCTGLLYCDTDSIAAHSIGTLPGGYGTDLGQWEKEGDFDHGAVCGKKLYAFHKKDTGWKSRKNYKVASKGVKLTPNKIYRIAKGESVTFTPKGVSFSVHRPPAQISRTISMTKKVLPENE